MAEELTSVQQTELGFPIEIVETMEAQGRWPDLTRLADRKPEVLRGIVWMLSHAVPVKEIQRALKVSPCTINAVRHHPVYGAAVVSESEDINQCLEFVLVAKARQLKEDAMEGKLPNTFDTKLLFDMLQLRTGGATQRVEIVASDAEREAQAFFEQASKHQASGMVLEAEVLSPMGPLVIGGGSLADGVPVTNLAADTDFQSTLSNV